MDKGADISECGRYRYRLWRRWSKEPFVGFLMLNPSTADADIDDPTIRRCMGFARTLGYGGIMVTNLFALRTPSPKVLKAFEGDRVGHPVNRDFVRTEAEACLKTIAAWGNHGTLDSHGALVRNMLRVVGIELWHLGLTRKGQPRHPLYLRSDTEPELWE